MPTITFDRALERNSFVYARWKTHGDWVEQIKIDKRLHQIFSCSNDEQNALVIGCILPSTDMSSVVMVPSASQNAAAGQANQQQQQQQQQQSQPLVTLPTIVITDTSGTERHQTSSESASNDNDSEIANYNNASQFNENTNSNAGGAKAAQSNANNASAANPFDALKFFKRRPEINETVFRINKGCKTFDFSFEKNLLITGGGEKLIHKKKKKLFKRFKYTTFQGLDRTIRLFNPYVPNKPIATLRSHTTPIFYIHLCHIDNRIFSMSTDKCLNVIFFFFWEK
jgi:hypothetical protein